MGTEGAWNSASTKVAEPLKLDCFWGDIETLLVAMMRASFKIMHQSCTMLIKLPIKKGQARVKLNYLFIMATHTQATQLT